MELLMFKNIIGKKPMKKCLGLVVLASLSGHVSAGESVDLLVVVEPAVYQTVTKEELHKKLVDQLNYANAEYSNVGIKLNIVSVLEWGNDNVSDRLSQGESFWDSLAGIMYSVRFNSEEFTSEFPTDLYGIEFDNAAHDLFRKYHADKLVFITAERDQQTGDSGYAFENIGFGLQVQGMNERSSLLAHEFGHNFGLTHPSEELCNQTDYLMCARTSVGTKFSEVEEMRINGVLLKDPTYLNSLFDVNLYSGWFSTPMKSLANVKISVVDNPIASTINETEVIVELVDTAGASMVLDNEVSIEIFTEAGTAIAGTHYDKSLYQRVLFAPGESSKRLDLIVTHSSSDVSLNVGARYGLNLNDSTVVPVTIKSNGNSDGNSGDSGGSMGFISMLMLAGLSLFRKK